MKQPTPLPIKPAPLPTLTVELVAANGARFHTATVPTRGTPQVILCGGRAFAFARATDAGATYHEVSWILVNTTPEGNDHAKSAA